MYYKTSSKAYTGYVYANLGVFLCFLNFSGNFIKEILCNGVYLL